MIYFKWQTFCLYVNKVSKWGCWSSGKHCAWSHLKKLLHRWKRAVAVQQWGALAKIWQVFPSLPVRSVVEVFDVTRRPKCFLNLQLCDLSDHFNHKVWGLKFTSLERCYPAVNSAVWPPSDHCSELEAFLRTIDELTVELPPETDWMLIHAVYAKVSLLSF